MLQPYSGLGGPLGRKGVKQNGKHEARGTRH
jgi:hypothetical protein